MFENLDVYQKAVDFIDQITNLTNQFPKGYCFLTDQLNRAGALGMREGDSFPQEPSQPGKDTYLSVVGDLPVGSFVCTGDDLPGLDC